MQTQLMLDKCRVIDNQFKALKNSEKSRQMQAYMQNHFVFYGISSPDRKSVQRQYINEFAQWSEIEFLNFAKYCFSLEEREWQYLACDLLIKVAAKGKIHSLETLEELVLTKSWWDTVDALAVNAIGSTIKQKSELIEWADKWIDSDEMWLRRTAILCQLKFKGQTDLERLSTYIQKCASEKEFFIRKSIGWALREYSKTDAEWVLNYTAKNELSGLSRREALKWLSRRQR